MKTVSILDEINKAVVELNDGPLGEAGLAIDLSFDASTHIRRASKVYQIEGFGASTQTIALGTSARIASQMPGAPTEKRQAK
ncbi:MAG: hypothetical protein IID57_01455 [Proteobacteria bacterium]|nr:hypothetical protein [Pseudomonadota bacterium]